MSDVKDTLASKLSLILNRVSEIEKIPAADLAISIYEKHLEESENKDSSSTLLRYVSVYHEFYKNDDLEIKYLYTGYASDLEVAVDALVKMLNETLETCRVNVRERISS